MAEDIEAAKQALRNDVAKMPDNDWKKEYRARDVEKMVNQLDGYTIEEQDTGQVVWTEVA